MTALTDISTRRGRPADSSRHRDDNASRLRRGDRRDRRQPRRDHTRLRSGVVVDPRFEPRPRPISASACVSLLGAQNAVGSFSCVVSGVAWGVLVEPIACRTATSSGALVVARQGRAWSSRERALTKAFGGLLSHTVTLASRESALLDQRRLDELVGQVAERLMSASSRTRQEVLTWTTRGAGRVPRRRCGLPAPQRPPAGPERPRSGVAARETFPTPTRWARCRSTPTRCSRRRRTCASRTCPGRRPADEYMDRVKKGSGAERVGGAVRAPAAGRHRPGASSASCTSGSTLDARGDQRPAGHRLHARPAPGPHRRRGADRVHRPPRRPDRAAQPSRPAPRAGGPPGRSPRDGHPLLRPRPLQGHERLLGSRQRRPRAHHHRRPDPHQHPRRTTSRPGSGATSS